MSTSLNLNSIYINKSITNKDNFLINKFENDLISNISTLTTYVDNKVTEILENVPSTLETLVKLSQTLEFDTNFSNSISTHLQSNVSSIKSSLYSLDNKLDNLNSKFNNSLQDCIYLLDNKLLNEKDSLNKNIVSLDSKLDNKLSNVNSTINSLDKKLDNKVDYLKSELLSTLDKLKSLESTSSSSNCDTNTKFNNITTILKEVQDKHSSLSTIVSDMNSEVSTQNLSVSLIKSRDNTLNILGNGNSSIFIGGTGDKVYLQGEVVNVKTHTNDVYNRYLTLNKCGVENSGFGVGFNVEEAGKVNGFVKTSEDRNSFDFKVPNNNNIVKLTPSNIENDLIVLESQLKFTKLDNPVKDSNTFKGPGYYNNNTDGNVDILLGGQNISISQGNLVYVPHNLPLVIPEGKGNWYALL